jgi:ligand-binding sensor domain-containing protein
VPRYAHPVAVPAEDFHLNALLEDNHGTLWIATFHGLFTLSPNHGFRRFTAEDVVAGQAAYAPALDRQGELWPQAKETGVIMY